MVAALAAGLGLRSGSRGGPVALEAADVRHVLLAPIDLGRAMRRPILRQARFAAFVSLVVGGIGGQLLARRTEGNAFEWTFASAAWGASVAALTLACAWLACGRRVSRRAASAAAVALLAWPVAEVAGAAPTSPFSLLGRIPMWPASAAPAALVVVPLIAFLAVVGIRGIGGVSVEEMARRSTLVGQIRFAATMRDLRTVLILRRQLSRSGRGTDPGFLAAGGAAGVATWRGAGGRCNAPRVPACCAWRCCRRHRAARPVPRGPGRCPCWSSPACRAFLVGLDAIEPLAQELDHETMLDLVAVPKGTAHAMLLVVPAITAVVMASTGVAAAALGGLDSSGLAVAATVAFTGALCGVAGAAISTVRGAPDPNDFSMLMLPPEAAGSRVVYEAALPPVVACLGFVPFLLARHAAETGSDPTTVLNSGILIGGMVFALTVTWVRARPAFKEQMAMAFNASEARKRAKRMESDDEDDD